MKRVLESFLEENFPGLSLNPGLFYAWENSLRFEIALPSVSYETKEYFQIALDRAQALFNQVFEEQDEILLVTDIHTEKDKTFLQRKPLNIYLKYIKHRQILLKLRHYLMSSMMGEEEHSITHRYIIPCRKTDLRYVQLLKAIIYEDFPHPSTILKNEQEAGYDVYFINNSKKVIYHLYDDRGCDVLASSKESLHKLYQDFNDWILEYDRKEIDHLFKDDVHE